MILGGKKQEEKFFLKIEQVKGHWKYGHKSAVCSIK